MSNRRCVTYARYSSREQDGTSTIESQIRECRACTRQHGLVIAETALFRERNSRSRSKGLVATTCWGIRSRRLPDSGIP